MNPLELMSIIYVVVVSIMALSIAYPLIQDYFGFDFSDLIHFLKKSISCYDRLVVKTIKKPYYLYKKIKPKKNVKYEDHYEFQLDKYFHFGDYRSIKYEQFVLYLKKFFEIMRIFIFETKEITSDTFSQEEIYEQFYIYVLRRIVYYDNSSSSFEAFIRKNNKDFVSFLEKNKPETIPLCTDCSSNQVKYYTLINHIKKCII